MPYFIEAFSAIPSEGTILGFHADGPLWFVRDLIVFNLISPLLFLIIDKLGKWGCAVMTLFYLASGFMPDFPLGSIKTFLIGMSLCYVDLEKLNCRFHSLVYVATLCLFIYLTFPIGGEDYLYQELSLMPLFVLLFVWSLYLLTGAYGDSIRQKLCDLSKYSFFIYASHGMYANLTTKTITSIISKTHLGYDFSLFWGYVATPIIIVVFSILVCKLLIRICPPLYRGLCGDR